MNKIAIVGVEGSGKTVLMAVMGDKYRSPDENGVFLAPVSRATYAYCAKLAASLRAGKWPFATESGVLNLDWTLMRRQTPGTAPAELGQLSFLDFGGEIYRLAFGDGAAVDLDEQRKQSVELLKGHVRDADALIVLVNLGDIINGSADDERTIEMNWLTQAILTYAFETAGKRNVALVFSQYDTYSETIAQCGGVRGTLSRYLPEVAARYGDRLSLFPIAAVDKTILAPDGSGYPIPAPDFKPLGLEELLQWMCNGVGSETGDYSHQRQNDAKSSPMNNGNSSNNKLIKAVSCVFKKYAVFSGRASKGEYWSMQLALLIINVASLCIGGIMEEIWPDPIIAPDISYGAIIFFATLFASPIPSLACLVRRFHDCGLSGMWILMPLVPFVVPLLPSQDHVNEYGPKPEPF